MADMEKDFLEEEDFGDNAVIVLTDGETGEDMEFDVLARAEIDGKLYYALAPVNEDGSEAEEYVILKVEEEENGDVSLCTIEDDDEYERIADVFDDLLFSEIDYDAE